MADDKRIRVHIDTTGNLTDKTTIPNVVKDVGKMNVGMKGWISNLKILQREFPLLGQAIRLLKNPFTALGIGIVTLIAQIKKAKEEINTLLTPLERRLVSRPLNLEATREALKQLTAEAVQSFKDIKDAIQEDLDVLEEMGFKLGPEQKLEAARSLASRQRAMMDAAGEQMRSGVPLSEAHRQVTEAGTQAALIRNKRSTFEEFAAQAKGTSVRNLAKRWGKTPGIEDLVRESEKVQVTALGSGVHPMLAQKAADDEMQRRISSYRASLESQYQAAVKVENEARKVVKESEAAAEAAKRHAEFSKELEGTLSNIRKLEAAVMAERDLKLQEEPPMQFRRTKRKVWGPEIGPFGNWKEVEGRPQVVPETLAARRFRERETGGVEGALKGEQDRMASYTKAAQSLGAGQEKWMNMIQALMVDSERRIAQLTQQLASQRTKQ